VSNGPFASESRNSPACTASHNYSGTRLYATRPSRCDRRITSSRLAVCDRTCARIVLDDREFQTDKYRVPHYKQVSGLVISDVTRGFVEVGYTGDFDTDNPFLDEEVSLIDMVAGEVSVLVEKYESEENKAKLQEQLRHADRLATIGQLAAGVAHELNEPLANILRFAQIGKKGAQTPQADWRRHGQDRAQLSARSRSNPYNVGSFAGLLLEEQGGNIFAVSDVYGGVIAKDGKALPMKQIADTWRKQDL
jgi:hypothetical protein